MRGPLAAVLAAALIAVSGCGNGGDDSAQTTPTATTDGTARPPAASTLPTATTQTQTQSQPSPLSPYSTTPQAPGEGSGNGGAKAPPSNGGTPAP